MILDLSPIDSFIVWVIIAEREDSLYGLPSFSLFTFAHWKNFPPSDELIDMSQNFVIPGYVSSVRLIS